MITDEQLMERYAESCDARAFGDLYTRFAPLLRRVIARHVYTTSDVDDLLQLTFMRLHTARTSYRAGERVKPWLCTIAVNASRDHLRRVRRRPEAHVDLEQLPALPERDELVERRPAAPVMAAVETLPSATRQLFQLHFFEDRPLADIARSLSEKPSTVRVRLHRGCQRVRAQLAC